MPALASPLSVSPLSLSFSLPPSHCSLLPRAFLAFSHLSPSLTLPALIFFLSCSSSLCLSPPSSILALSFYSLFPCILTLSLHSFQLPLLSFSPFPPPSLSFPLLHVTAPITPPSASRFHGHRLYRNMPHAPKTSINSAKLQTKRSAWTPLNHAPSNSQLFEERRVLLAKWFSMWTESQKKTILQDLIQSCSLDQLMLLSFTVSRRLPLQAADFTCMLPRALSLYIFSFLDPRSLCRCAQVSWQWKNIVDLDQLWMVKCLRRGWFLDYSPIQFEVSVWKRHYISTVQRLRSAAVQQQQQQQQQSTDLPTADSPHQELCLEDALLSEPRPESNNSSTKKQKQTNRTSLCLPPWRDTDRRPRDIVRFNYLDNSHSVDEAWTVKTQRPASKCNSSTSAPLSSSKPELRNKTLTDAHYKLRKAKSLMFLSSNCRLPPSPPIPLDQSEPRIHSIEESVKKLLRESQFNAGVRPGPVRSSVPRMSVQGLRTAQRSHRSIPSTPLLDFIQPWTVSSLNTEL